MENLLISACLVGYNVKYNGKNNYKSFIEELKKKYNLILICPESAGGLTIPRVPSEIKDGKVYSKTGLDVTSNFDLGAKKVLEKCIRFNCKKALLKESSPSCGVNKVYDGNFSDTKIPGIGVCAKLLKEHGIELYTENDIDKLL